MEENNKNEQEILDDSTNNHQSRRYCLTINNPEEVELT